MNENEKRIVFAIEHYRKSSILFLKENLKMESNMCLLKMANLMGSINMVEFDEKFLIDAANVFLDLGRDSMQENLSKFNTRKYFVKSGLLLLATISNNKNWKNIFQQYLKYFHQSDALFQNS